MTGGSSSFVKIWDVATGELYREINVDWSCWVAHFLTIGEELHIVGSIMERTLTMWHMDTRNSVWSTTLFAEDDDDHSFSAIAVSPDQSLIATGLLIEGAHAPRGKLFLHDQAGEYIRHVDVPKEVKKLVFTNDGSKIIAAQDILVLYNAHDLSVLKLLNSQGLISYRLPLPRMEELLQVLIKVWFSYGVLMETRF